MLTLSATVAASGTKMAIGEAAITALLGYAVVFIGLVMLMVVIIIVGKIMTAGKGKKAPAAETVKAEAAPVEAEKAPGSAGGVKLYDVPEREAAMIMAIVADKMGKPLNELRFKSIKEVRK